MSMTLSAAIAAVIAAVASVVPSPTPLKWLVDSEELYGSMSEITEPSALLRIAR
jgi:hypothetical protein